MDFSLRSCRRFTGAALVAVALAACTCGGPAPEAAVRSENLRVGTLDRHFLVFAPPLSAKPAGILIAFHPSGSSGTRMREMGGRVLERMAGERGVIIAYPDGYEGHFDDCRREASYSARTLKIDDVGFSRAIVDQLAREYPVDRRRVFALGYSNGGAMAIRMALEAPDLVAAVVAIAANMPAMDNLDCPVVEGRHVRVVLVEGTADHVNPYAGGEVSILGLASRGTVLSAEDSAKWFASRYGAAANPNPGPHLAQDDMAADWRDWGSPMPVVRLITIHGGGHTIPQADRRFPRILGRTFLSDAPLKAAWEVMDPAG